MRKWSDIGSRSAFTTAITPIGRRDPVSRPSRTARVRISLGTARGEPTETIAHARVAGESRLTVDREGQG